MKGAGSRNEPAACIPVSAWESIQIKGSRPDLGGRQSVVFPSLGGPSPVNPYTHREAWLHAAADQLRAMFAQKGYVVPTCQVSCGFASTGVRSGHIGQCWSRRSSRDGINQIFISPALEDPVEVLDTLVHELVPAVDDCHRHSPRAWGPIRMGVCQSQRRQRPARPGRERAARNAGLKFRCSRSSCMLDRRCALSTRR